MLVERMIRAARLDPELYNEVERDPSATGQAFAVVLIVAVCGLFGSALGGKTPASRQRDLLLKVLTHDLMVL